MKKYWTGTAEGMGHGTDRSLMPSDMRWELAAHALCAYVSAEEMEKLGPGWLAGHIKQKADASKFLEELYTLRSQYDCGNLTFTKLIEAIVAYSSARNLKA